jgi:hypothetical protein
VSSGSEQANQIGGHLTTLDEGLKQYATARQAEYIEAYNQCGTYEKAAAFMKVDSSGIRRAIQAVKKKAALSGYSPEHDMIKPVPEPFIVRGVSTYYNAEGKASGQWVKSKVDDRQVENMVRDFVEVMAESIKGLAPLVEPPKHSNDDLMCVYPMGDPHFGMYAWWQDAGDDFDLDIAEKLTCGAVDRLVASAPSSHTALLLNLGDMFHADNQKNVTNSGHQLDVDGRWAKVQQVGLRATIYCLQRLLEKHQKVIFRINRGNHDGHSSYALALMISCYFHNEPRLEVDLSPSTVWYYQFGKVLIGSTHGDTIKGANMMGVMAADKPVEWGSSVYRVWYVGHVHHADLKEYPGGIVEYFRTLAARDAWHQGQGYRAGRDMCCIVHHKDHGEIERHRCDIGMLKEAA